MSAGGLAWHPPAPSVTTLNQAPRMPAHNAWHADISLQYWLAATAGEVDDDAMRMLGMVGAAVGGHELQDAAERANHFPPQLRTFDRQGNRLDEVSFDAAWHRLLLEVMSSGACALPWQRRDDGYLLRAAAAEMWSRLDMGVMCPVSMTTGAIAVLARAGDEHEHWMRRLVLDEPTPAIAGMAMTEPQGGSDLAGSSTSAVEQQDGSFLLNGYKWFVSHPVADVLLVLARESGMPDDTRGLSCFVVPGWLHDGTRNGIELQRLKDKLGTRSLASAEVILRNARAHRVGVPGAGVRTIIDMVVHTRMDCAIGSTGIMTRAVQEAVSHACGRRAFGKRLVEQPLMRMTLADLAIEREASLALAFEVARTFQADDRLQRLVPAFAKYWITRRAVAVAVEAVEVLGGNGYTEAFTPARLFRDAQVNSTWEGSGNVIVLDAFRALGRDPSLLDDLTQCVRDLGGDNLAGCLPAMPTDEGRGRGFVARLATVLQAALLAARAHDTGDEVDGAVASAFAATRLHATGERAFGDGGTELAGAVDGMLDRYRLDR